MSILLDRNAIFPSFELFISFLIGHVSFTLIYHQTKYSYVFGEGEGGKRTRENFMWNMVTLSLKCSPCGSEMVLHLWFFLYCGKSTGLPYVYILERIMRSVLENTVWWIMLLHVSLWGSIIMHISPQGQGEYLKRKLQCNVKNRLILTSVSRTNKSLNKYFNGLKIQSKRAIPQGG